jgi:hypothetical protein
MLCLIIESLEKGIEMKRTLRINMKNNVKDGDRVHVFLHDLNVDFMFDRECEIYANYIAHLEDGVIYVGGCNIDSLYDQNHAPKQGSYAEFLFATREKDEEIDEVDSFLSRQDVLTLFRKEDGSVWFISRDNHPILLHGARGNVTAKYARQCIDSYGFPGGMSRYKRFDVPLK